MGIAKDGDIWVTCVNVGTNSPEYIWDKAYAVAATTLTPTPDSTPNPTAEPTDQPTTPAPTPEPTKCVSTGVVEVCCGAADTVSVGRAEGGGVSEGERV